MDENLKNETGEETEVKTETPESKESQKPLAEQKIEKTFSQEELNKAISARLSQEKEKHEKILAEKLSEAEKLAKMNAEQKAVYEKERNEKQLSEREAAVSRRELEAEAKMALSEKGLPIELAECLSYKDAESCKKSMEAIEKAFAGTVEKKLNEKLKQEPPKKNNDDKNKDPFLSGLGL